MYKTIVVGFDNSEFSKAALTESSKLAKKHNGQVIIVHAIDKGDVEPAIEDELVKKRFMISSKVCYEMRALISSEYMIEADSIICEGDPSDVIPEIARAKNADLIAMGTYGRKGLKRLVIGSVTARVISNSECDVLILKKPCKECTGEYSSILVPFDSSEFSKRALARACRISKADNSMVTVLYTIPRYEEMLDFFMTSSIKQGLMNEAQKIIDTAKGIAMEQGVSAKTVTAEGHVADRIIETSKRLENDLIVIGTHGWRGVNKAIMGSTTERVIINASCPILVVH